MVFGHVRRKMLLYKRYKEYSGCDHVTQYQ